MVLDGFKELAERLWGPAKKPCSSGLNATGFLQCPFNDSGLHPIEVGVDLKANLRLWQWHSWIGSKWHVESEVLLGQRRSLG